MSVTNEELLADFTKLIESAESGDQSIFEEALSEVSRFEDFAKLGYNQVSIVNSNTIKMRDGILKVQAGAPRGHISNLTEDLITAAILRVNDVDSSRGGKFACEENKIALAALTVAMRALNNRSARRKREQQESR